MRYLSVIHIPKTETLRAVMFVAVALNAGSLFAGGQVFWQEGGVVVCDSTASGGQAAVSDDSGGVFVVWLDRRGEDGSIWAQHLDGDGNAMWQQNGVFVGDGDPSGINQLSAVSDGRGGLVATWKEGDDLAPYERHQVTAQRLDATGTVLWDSTGVVVACSDSDFTYEVATVSDGRGGAVVGWRTVAWESTGVCSLVVQRIDSLGDLCWGNPGLVMATLTVDAHVLCSDGAGGACVAWHFGGWNGHLVAQHVDSAGYTTWPGIGVSLLPPGWFLCRMTPLLAGYVIVGKMVDSLYAQRIDAHGQVLWDSGGRPVYRHGTPGYTCVFPGLDSSICVVWTEERAGVIGIYAQLLNASGERQWDSLGVEVGTTNDNDSYLFGCVPAGDDFIASWPRNSHGPTRWDIYAQHVDAAGQLLWGEPGLDIAVDSGYESRAPSVVTDARQGAIIIWAVGGGLKAQRAGDVSSVAGQISVPLLQPAIRARPIPARGGSALQWPVGLGSRVGICDASGRRVTTLLGFLSGDGSMRADWNGQDDQGRRVPPGVYVCTLDTGTEVLTQKVVLAR